MTQPKQKQWQTPVLEKVDMKSTSGGPAPQNNENVNFFLAS